MAKTYKNFKNNLKKLAEGYYGIDDNNLDKNLDELNEALFQEEVDKVKQKKTNNDNSEEL